jgi:hypothetical protein
MYPELLTMEQRHSGHHEWEWPEPAQKPLLPVPQDYTNLPGFFTGQEGGARVIPDGRGVSAA